MRAALRLLAAILLLIWTCPAAAQTIRAKQLIVTDGQGSVLQMPTMTTAERDASTHNNGETVHCSDCSPAGVYFYFAGSWHESGSGSAGGSATYITQTPDASLSAEQALSLLATGLMFSTTATGIVSIYAGSSCPGGQAVTAISAAGVPTCAAITSASPGQALSGSVTISGTDTTGSVTLSPAQADTNYYVTLGTRPVSGTPPHVVADYGNKLTTGFDVTITAPPGAGNSVAVDWSLNRAGGTAVLGSGTTNYLAKWLDANTLTGIAFTDDNIVVGSGTDWVLKALPSCSGGANALTYNTGTNAFGCNTIAAAAAYRQCAIVVGADNGPVLVDGDLGPQGRQCFAPVAGTVVQVTVAADGGTPSILPRRNSGGTTTNLLSGALSTAAAGGIACAKTTGVTGFDGVTTCAATLTGTTLAAGDFVELISGTAGGVAKRMTIIVTWSEP